MNITLAKILPLVIGSLVSFSMFGLTYAAVLEDGVLRALSGAILLGLCSFGIAFLAAKSFVDMGK